MVGQRIPVSHNLIRHPNLICFRGGCQITCCKTVRDAFFTHIVLLWAHSVARRPCHRQTQARPVFTVSYSSSCCLISSGVAFESVPSPPCPRSSSPIRPKELFACFTVTSTEVARRTPEASGLLWFVAVCLLTPTIYLFQNRLLEPTRRMGSSST